VSCECSIESAYCAVHALYLSKEQHRQCREDAGMFESFQRLKSIAARRNVKYTPDTKRQEKPRVRRMPHNGADCAYHGEQIGSARCGCASEQKETPVFSCEKHGRCADKPIYPQPSEIVLCRWCKDFTVRSIQQPAQ
jgi:hypothetical protein